MTPTPWIVLGSYIAGALTMYLARRLGETSDRYPRVTATTYTYSDTPDWCCCRYVDCRLCPKTKHVSERESVRVN